MRTSTARGAGQTGALFNISGSIGSGETWWQDLSFDDDGQPITDAENWDWTLTFRENEGADDAVLTLTTDDGTLNITQGATFTALEIRVEHTALSDLEGDYICDLSSLDTSTTPDRKRHWGHGVVSVRNEPL